MFVRISATDWVEGGWSLAESVEFARRLARSASTCGLLERRCRRGREDPRSPRLPGAVRGRRAEGVRRGDGRRRDDHSAEQAEQILATGQADAVFLARELLRNPYWPLVAARRLGATVNWPKQYLRARP